MKRQITLINMGFKAPFRACGLWVEDAAGRNVCETTHDLAKAIAASLNQLYSQG